MTESDMAAPPGVEVLSPLGYPPKITALSMAPRLQSLDGTTIGFLDCRFEGTDQLIAQIQAWFADNMPTVSTTVVQIEKSFAADPKALSELASQASAAIVLVGT